jgi:hypothetical protein
MLTPRAWGVPTIWPVHCREVTLRVSADAPVYGRFTEGFDTPDLKEAKGLLETLDA